MTTIIMLKMQAHKLLEIKTVYEPFFTLNFTGFYRTYIHDAAQSHYSNLSYKPEKLTLPVLGLAYEANIQRRQHSERTNGTVESSYRV